MGGSVALLQLTRSPFSEVNFKTNFGVLQVPVVILNKALSIVSLTVTSTHIIIWYFHIEIWFLSLLLITLRVKRIELIDSDICSQHWVKIVNFCAYFVREVQAKLVNAVI